VKKLFELAKVFLKLGTIGFGGPAAHIAMMEGEVVAVRGWVTPEEFLDMLGMTHLIPGPNSTEMAIHIGYRRAGVPGLIVAGLCFILPAVLITLGFAWIYGMYGGMWQLDPFTYGVRIAMIAVIAGALYRLAGTAIKDPFTVVVFVAVTGLSLLGVDEILLLIAAGLAGLWWKHRLEWAAYCWSFSGFFAASFGGLFPGSSYLISLLAQNSGAATLTSLGTFFLVIGSVLYGSGYVLIAYLRGGLVDQLHWITQHQLLDAIAVGQFTPGPVLSAATFIGYLILGFPGAGVATLSIFLPSFFFVLISNPFIPRLRKSIYTGAILDGVNAASLGLMFAVALMFCSTMLTTLTAWVIFLAAMGALLFLELNPVWIVLGSSALGWLLTYLFW
jgi:chromate transporter